MEYIDIFDENRMWRKSGGKKMKIVVGGIIEKDGKVLLVQEAKEKCYGKWNISAGGLEPNESIMNGAIREVKEETGCDVELTGIVSIDYGVIEDKAFMAIIFSTKLLNENIKFNKDEILDVQWYDIDDVIGRMDDKLRNSQFMKHSLLNLKNGNIGKLNIINEF